MPLSRKSSRPWRHTGTPSLGTNLSASSVLTTVLTYIEKIKAGATKPEGGLLTRPSWGGERGEESRAGLPQRPAEGWGVREEKEGGDTD